MTGPDWRVTIIGVNRCHIADAGDRRLYVKERPSTIEAWVDSVKIGNFANVLLAKLGCEKHIGRAVHKSVKPSARAIQAARRAAVKRSARRAAALLIPDPREVGPPRKMIVGKIEGRKPPVRVEDEVKLHKFPIADLAQPPVEPMQLINGGLAQCEAFIRPQPHATMQVDTRFCKCGTRLGRSGKCPALCTPVPQPAPAYRGPMVVGRTHSGRIGAPVWRPEGDGWIG